jgi:serine/threonine protein kinase
MERNHGDKLGRYEIVRAIGKGGIAGVWKARDVRLQRDVAIRFCPKQFSARSAPRGPLAPQEAVRLALGIADALEAAHEKGITHRDLKPANVLVTQSGLKLLDLGLALVEDNSGAAFEDAATGLTAAGTVAGGGWVSWRIVSFCLSIFFHERFMQQALNVRLVWHSLPERKLIRHSKIMGRQPNADQPELRAGYHATSSARPVLDFRHVVEIDLIVGRLL